MGNYEIKFVNDVPEADLHAFFTEAFNKEKADFLVQYSDWWHRNSKARFVAIDTDKQIPVGYSALISSQVAINGKREDIYWLVDVMVLNTYRGQGIQRLVDEEIQKEQRIRIGFPNELASKIHRKHGWGVRVDGYRWQYTLSLRANSKLRFYPGLIGKALRAVAKLTTPLYQRYRVNQVGQRQSSNVQLLEEPNAEDLGHIFLNHHPQPHQITTYRDADFIQWRYLDAPYRSDLRFYTASQHDKPVLAMITRELTVKGLRTLRILDLFGNLDYTEGLQNLIHQAQLDAIEHQIEELIIVVTAFELTSALEHAGFTQRDIVTFCWLSDNPEDMQRIEVCSPYWTFTDSDLDYSF